MAKGEPITTYLGVSFYILDPKEEDIFDEDIAHALSLLCRGNGHYREFYSVAQHSLNCLCEAKARGYSLRCQMACLVHDGSEAYISDITRPVKQYLPTYRDYEETIQNLVYKHYGLSTLTDEEKQQLSQVDDTVLYYEFRALHKPFSGPAPKKYGKLDFSSRNPKEVEAEFLQALRDIKDSLSLF